MRFRDNIHRWWKKFPLVIRQGLAFIVGIFFIILSPILAPLPGPGGFAVFLLGIAILASEFHWAELLKEFFFKTVPREVKNRFEPTPRWQRLFDVTALTFILVAAASAYHKIWEPVLSLGVAGITIFIFNRNRINRTKKYFKNKRK